MTADELADELTRISQEGLAKLPPEERERRLQAFYKGVDEATKTKDP